MTDSQGRPSPFPPADETPFQRAPPLAPSQELAYRKKCIELRRRLTEIEQNNDATRARIAREKDLQNKIRLNRAILLHHLQEIMALPARKISKEEMDDLGTGLGGSASVTDRLGYRPTETAKKRSHNDYLEDSSDETEDEEIREVGWSSRFLVSCLADGTPATRTADAASQSQQRRPS